MTVAVSLPATIRRLVARYPILALAMLAGCPGSSHAQWLARPDPYQECFQAAMNDPARAISLAGQMLSPLAADPIRQVVANDCMARARMLLGQGDAATEAAQQLLSLLERSPSLPLPLVQQARLNAVSTLASAGQPAQAEQVFVETYQQARADLDVPLQIAALAEIGSLIASNLHDDATAAGYLESALGMARQVGLPQLMLQYSLLQTELDRHDAAGAQQRLSELRRVRLAEDAGVGITLRLDTAEARIDLAMQRPQLALPLLQASLLAQRRIQDMIGVHSTLLALGQAESELNHQEPARNHSLEALQLAERAHVDTIPALQQLLDISLQTQDQAGVELYRQRLTPLTSEISRKRWRQQIQAMVARLGPPPGLNLPSSQAATAISADITPEHGLGRWLIALSLLLGGAGIYLAWQQRRYFSRRLQLSSIDPLCQVLTRRETTMRIDRQMLPTAGFLAAGRPSILLMLIDIDHFKHINDNHGHLTGDTVLAEIAARLKACCRDQDIIGRWGGEEFLIACRSTDALDAAASAMRICKSIADTPIRTSTGQSINVSVSIGAAPWPFVPDASRPGHWRDVLLPADTALYAVKRSGRNGWAIIHGTAQADPHAIEQLMSDPATAQQQGQLIIHSNHQLQWPLTIAPAA